MPVIRSTEAHGSKSAGTPLDLGDLRRRAELLQSQAREQARAILAEAHAERARILSGAREEGHGEGFARGLAEGTAKGEGEGAAKGLADMREQITRVLEAWGDALAAFLDGRDAMLLQAREDVLQVAARVATLATRRTVELDPTVVRDQLEDVLGRVLEPTRLRVRVHPEDAARARDVMPELMRRLGEAAHAELVEVAELGRGSVVVETERGVIDSSMEMRLGRLVDALLPPRGSAGPSEAV
jgi:flagellar assembly protein FliH